MRSTFLESPGSELFTNLLCKNAGQDAAPCTLCWAWSDCLCQSPTWQSAFRCRKVRELLQATPSVTAQGHRLELCRKAGCSERGTSLAHSKH